LTAFLQDTQDFRIAQAVQDAIIVLFGAELANVEFTRAMQFHVKRVVGGFDFLPSKHKRFARSG
jgi:hypothetical protein